LKKLLLVLALLMAVSQTCIAQVGGGQVYGQDRTPNAQANERAKRAVTKDQMPPNATSMFLDASVLINVRADEYVAVFAISHEGASLDEARDKVNTTISRFTGDLKQLGVDSKELYVDFIAQNRVYGFDVEGDLAREKVSGFEVKKTVAVRYRSEPLLDKLVAAASRSGIFDLVKVDYLVKDIAGVQSRLMEHAAAVLKRKAANHARLLGVSLRQPQVYAERYSAYYPKDMYSSYVAQSTEDVSGAYSRQRFTIQGARKPRTFYFDALSAETFDQVVNQAVTEPVVQFSLYLKVKYDTGRAAPRASDGVLSSGRRR
jgi:uncharacterized protein YggE